VRQQRLLGSEDHRLHDSRCQRGGDRITAGHAIRARTGNPPVSVARRAAAPVAASVSASEK
jgi:hypothetical protein